MFCQTPARQLLSVGRKAKRQGSENANNTTIWNIWYLESTQIPPQLQNQQGLKQRGRNGSLTANHWLVCRNADMLISKGLPE